jgi:serine/threonine protein kinase
MTAADVRADSGSASAWPRVGTLLGGRYRLWERLGGRDGSTEWRAADETMPRPVAVWTFLAASARAAEVTAAARAVARVNDPRLARVLDANRSGETCYVVTEWPPGSRLGELLATGGVPPWRAARMIASAAEALAVAHDAGLAHLSLTPDSLWCDARNRVTITGLGIAAALAGPPAEDPALADTRGLARLLYAALTGYWPGPEDVALLPAPRPDGRLRGPGEIRPGIPAPISAIACRALSGEACAADPPIFGPAQLAMELAMIIDTGRPLTLWRGPATPAPPPSPAAPQPAEPASTLSLPPVLAPTLPGRLGRLPGHVPAIIVMLAVVAVLAGAGLLLALS